MSNSGAENARGKRLAEDGRELIRLQQRAARLSLDVDDLRREVRRNALALSSDRAWAAVLTAVVLALAIAVL